MELPLVTLGLELDTISLSPHRWLVLILFYLQVKPQTAAMATDFKRCDTGTNTAEEQISGPRAACPAKQQQEDQKDCESKKQKIQVHTADIFSVA